MKPGCKVSVNSLRLMTPLIGNPFPRPYPMREDMFNATKKSNKMTVTLAITRISGFAPLSSTANQDPVRQNPLCTSSMISMMPCLSQIFLKPCRNSGGEDTYPPSPSTGSIMIAAVSLGVVCWARSSSS